LQEELIRKNLETERLEELNKQKTMFVSTVSHDLKTPLASIKVFSEIMKNDKKITDKQKDYMEIIEGESDRLTRLINNVLDFAWIENGTRQYTFKSVSLNRIVRKTVDILGYQIRMEGFKVEVKLSSDESYIYADSDAVIQVLTNLIGNAIKFSVKQKHLSISTFRSENYFCVEIRDKGIGIKEEDLRNLFKPFFRSRIAGDKKIGGTGLGLSIIKHVMDAHKVKIDVESVPDEGTSFILKFPVDEDQKTESESTGLINNSLDEEED
jgi:two-component system phosphate regulon sensor histidine kinase PhoR